jgi:hypothetical protein
MIIVICRIKNQASGKVIEKGLKRDIYFLSSFPLMSISFGCTAVVNNSHVWHKKLGHSNSIVLTYLMKHSYLGNKNLFWPSTMSSDCGSCKLGKSKSLPFPSHGSQASACFEIIHTTIWGISPVISHAWYKYFMIFIDDYSHFIWVFLFFCSKADVFFVFQNFIVYAENQFSNCMKTLR